VKPPEAPAHRLVAIAIGAHPDDIEFQMAGTLLLLREAGWETHYLNLCSGNCGSLHQKSATTRQRRASEARRAARLLGARFHPSLADDLELFYDLPTLRRVASALRGVRPSLVLTHSPRNYMEDHVITCRLAVTAAFARGMPNFKTLPARPAYQGEVAVYHCMPHGLRDGLRRRIAPGAFVNTASVQAAKHEALSAHQSQQQWLEASQGMNSYLSAMHGMSLELGRMSGRFTHAEGWRRHLHLGFSPKDDDPLAATLGKNYLVNRGHERNLNRGE
jgi:LmbE family N-acetylglucosaminyl deacetylase